MVTILMDIHLRKFLGSWYIMDLFLLPLLMNLKPKLYNMYIYISELIKRSLR